MSIPAKLKQRATISRATSTVQSGGEVDISWSDVATDVPCLVQISQVKIKNTDAGRTLSAKAKMFFMANADIRPAEVGEMSDRITVDSIGYEVTGVVPDASGRDKLLVVYAEKV
jgi:hypothetical protein